MFSNNINKEIKLTISWIDRRHVVLKKIYTH